MTISKPWRTARLLVIAAAPLFVTATVRAEEVDLSVYVAFGKIEGITKIVDDGVDRLLKDVRIKDRFADANIPRLKRMLSAQFCALLHGPCPYEGRSMAQAHQGMYLGNADFNALVEDFQFAMDDCKVPFRDQNKLLALLAPMQRDVVTK